MSVKQVYFILFSLIISLSCKAQGKVKRSLKQEVVNYQYDNDRPTGEFYTPKTEIGKEIEIDFLCCFNDTVEIYINDKFERKVFLETNESTSSTGFSLTVKFDKAQSKKELKIVLPQKKGYSKILLDKRYRILVINRMEHWNESWWITFRNFGYYLE